MTGFASAAIADDTGVYTLFDSLHFHSLSNITDSNAFAGLQRLARTGSHASQLKVGMLPLTQVSW